MKDERFIGIWHALNEANVEVVMAAEAPLKQRRERMCEALRQSRQAVALILEVLSERAEEDELLR